MIRKRRVIINPATAELKRPWRNRARMDLEVTGAIELAYSRGYQAGWEDACKEEAARPDNKKRPSGELGL